MRADRLLKLADFIENVVPTERWNFQQFFRSPVEINEEIIKAASDPNAFNCGSVGCALGWAPKCFPEDLKYMEVKGLLFDRNLNIVPKDPLVIPPQIDYRKTFDTAIWFFDLSRTEVLGLFSPHEYIPGWMEAPILRAESTKEEVAAKIRKFVRWKTLHQINYCEERA